MNFLQLGMLWALPLAAVPVIIHLIHQQRHRTVKWAAMMFLLDSRRLNTGIDRLRQILILAMRVLAVLFLVFAVSRPLVTGWVGIALGGRADTTLILLDRSASMEQTDAASGLSKRETALRQLVDALEKGVRAERIVLIDSARLEPVEIERPEDLLRLPQTGSTATRANLPALVQTALDYAVTQKIGNAEVWLCSDLQASDWQPESGTWASLREAARELRNLRWRLVAFPEASPDNVGVRVEAVRRRLLPGGSGAELLLDVELFRQGEGPATVSLGVVVNGVRALAEVAVEGSRTVVRGLSVPVARETVEGWGMVELPADRNPQDDRAYFAFAPEVPRRSLVVAAREEAARPALAALRARAEPGVGYEAEWVPSGKVGQVDWEAALLVVWQAPLPSPDSLEAKQLENFVQSGRSVLFLPPDGDTASAGEARLFGMGWGAVSAAEKEEGQVAWWRTDGDLLQNTGNGRALPLGELKVRRSWTVAGDGLVLARGVDGGALLARADVARGNVCFCGLSPVPESSNLAEDGVVFFVLLHRLLARAAAGGSLAQHWEAGAGTLADGTWERVAGLGEAVGEERGFQAGVFRNGSRWRALHLAEGESETVTLGPEMLGGLLEGFDYQVIAAKAGDGGALAHEVWRSLVALMGVALLVEAVLCLPAATEVRKGRPEPA
jgi:hypothetical protein